jgi:hypothetical protein
LSIVERVERRSAGSGAGGCCTARTIGKIEGEETSDDSDEESIGGGDGSSGSDAGSGVGDFCSGLDVGDFGGGLGGEATVSDGRGEAGRGDDDKSSNFSGTGTSTSSSTLIISSGCSRRFSHFLTVLLWLLKLRCFLILIPPIDIFKRRILALALALALTISAEYFVKHVRFIFIFIGVDVKFDMR